MLFPISLLIAPFLTFTLASSFYDNPEQDPIRPTNSDAAEELHHKWDFEVMPFQKFPFCLKERDD